MTKRKDTQKTKRLKLSQPRLSKSELDRLVEERPSIVITSRSRPLVSTR
jgi:hypothetical protein